MTLPPPRRGSGRGRKRGPAGRTRPGRPERGRSPGMPRGTRRRFRPAALGAGSTGRPREPRSRSRRRESRAAGPAAGPAPAGPGPSAAEGRRWPAGPGRAAAGRPGRPPGRWWPPAQPTGWPSLAFWVVMPATATVVMNRARTRPLTARNAARGSSASRRAAISAPGRLVRRAMIRAPVIVSHGPAMTRPTMISRQPGTSAWICPGTLLRAAVHDEEAELGQPGQQREHPPGPRRLRGHPAGDAERGDVHPAQRQPGHDGGRGRARRSRPSGCRAGRATGRRGRTARR